MGGAKKSQQYRNYFFECSTFATKDLEFEHGGAKLVSCLGRHLTSERAGQAGSVPCYKILETTFLVLQDI